VKLRLSGTRVLGELVVIVAGILIALAADASWKGRMDKGLERTYLEAFKVDLEQTILSSSMDRMAFETFSGTLGPYAQAPYSRASRARR
jgi:hypothetical protein